MDVAESVAIVAVVAVLLLAGVLLLRRIILVRAGGFDVCWRPVGDEGGRGWTLGQARYRRSRISLYRAFSPLPSATVDLGRSQLRVGAARRPEGADVDLLPPNVLIVDCSCAGTALEMALAPDALTGLRSWVESRPPDPRTVGNARRADRSG